jgi:hypothetical protein
LEYPFNYLGRVRDVRAASLHRLDVQIDASLLNPLEAVLFLLPQLGARFVLLFLHAGTALGDKVALPVPLSPAEMLFVQRMSSTTNGTSAVGHCCK